MNLTGSSGISMVYEVDGLLMSMTLIYVVDVR